MPRPCIPRPPLLGLLLILLALLAACASQPGSDAGRQPAIDLQRFMGRWHVIAHIPYFAERGHVASRQEYALRENGRIAVRYVYQEGFGQPVETLESRAKVKGGTGNREWAQRFYGVVPAKLRILEVAPDYSWALVDYPGRDMGWIYARTPTMDEALYQQLVMKMRDYGVNARQLVRVPQLPEQVGQPGFADPEKP